jgi:hypothetical protein
MGHAHAAAARRGTEGTMTRDPSAPTLERWSVISRHASFLG